MSTELAMDREGPIMTKIKEFLSGEWNIEDRLVQANKDMAMQLEMMAWRASCTADGKTICREARTIITGLRWQLAYQIKPKLAEVLTWKQELELVEGILASMLDQ